MTQPSRPRAASALVLAASSQPALLDALESGASGGDGLWRLAVFDPTPQKLGVARAAVAAGRPRHGRDGIHFAPGGLVHRGGKVAFLFPGVEAAFAPQVADIAGHFGLPPPDVDAVDLEHQGIRVFTLSLFLDRVAAQLGLRPHMVAGHSIGEWSGMVASGMIEGASVDDFMAALEPGTLRVAEVTYVAVGAGAGRTNALIADLAGVVVSHDNCLHQSIVCGPHAQIEQLMGRLREQQILHELLPFRSGFHSPALADHLDAYAANLAKVELAAPAIPLWSATTCAPYPADPQQVSALFLEHLVRPVRFRELILALHDDGARAFVQMGTGSLAAFVDDVLHDRPHYATSLVAPHRPGLEQLRRACAALYVEGVPVDLGRLGLAPPAARQDAPVQESTARHPVLREFDANMRELAAAQQEVVQAFAAAAAPSDERCDARPLALSVAAYPELLDHCLIPQAKHWPTLADRAPAVPMTMSVALLMEAAARADPRRTPVGVLDVTASAWLYVEPPVDVPVVCTRVAADRIRVSLGNFIEGTVTLAERIAEAPPPSARPLVDVSAFPIGVAAIYRDGWLFHGPRYQGIVEIDAYGSNGIDGTLEALPAKGALLDAAGQLVGLWVMLANETDRLSMPVRVGKVEFFGADPAPGDLFACTVRVRHAGRHEVHADVELSRNGRVHARMSAWQYWRFETGGPIFEVMRQPDRNLLASICADGYALLAGDRWTASATMEFLARRYVSAADLEALGGMRQARRRRDWLAGRIVAKDAVRKLLFDRGHGPLFPMEVVIETDAAGRPHVRGPFAGDLRVSIAHKAGIACAVAADGVDPGIDVERIETRSEEFAALAFGADERALLCGGDRDEWLTRCWCAKEAAGKARGTGLAGDPKRLKLTRVDGERLVVDGSPIETRRIGEHVVAWTVQ